MLNPLLSRIVAIPQVYDLVQRLAGERKLYRRLEGITRPFATAGVVLDIGGGTGLYRHLWHARHFCCVDLDPLKLSGFRKRNPLDVAIAGDATRLPIAERSVDVAVITAVAHHIPDDVLPRFFAEVARVLKPGGRLLFVDPVWEPSRLAGRLLWRYDRGAFPRRAEVLREHIAGALAIEHWERFTIFHAYAICVARPRSAGAE